MPEEHTFIHGLGTDQREALLSLRASRREAVPEALRDQIDSFIVSAEGFEATRGLALAIYHAGAAVGPELMAIGAGMFEWMWHYGFGDIGKPRGDTSAVAFRMAQALKRDAGMPAPASGWPAIEQDPQRGEVEPAPLVMPST